MIPNSVIQNESVQFRQRPYRNYKLEVNRNFDFFQFKVPERQEIQTCLETGGCEDTRAEGNGG